MISVRVEFGAAGLGRYFKQVGKGYRLREQLTRWMRKALCLIVGRRLYMPLSLSRLARDCRVKHGIG